MIPKIIHQIWIGTKKMPKEWMDTWKEHHPDWEYRLWTETEIDAFRLENNDKYAYYYRKGKWDGAADIARIEILKKYGGFYIDADSVCVKPLEESWLKYGFVAAYEYDFRIANGIMGSVPEGIIVSMYKSSVRVLTQLEPACFTVGGTELTNVVMKYGSQGNVCILPRHYFYPRMEEYRGKDKKEDIYTVHIFGSTKGKYE